MCVRMCGACLSTCVRACACARACACVHIIHSPTDVSGMRIPDVITMVDAGAANGV